MSEHAKYSPSKLAMILACPASGSVEEPRSSSVYAEEGTRLHGVTEAGLITHLKGQSWATKIRSFNLDVEQLNAVEECMLYAVDLIGRANNPEVIVEDRVYIAKDCHGTPDLVIKGLDELHVVDWKFGQGVEVSAVDNTQLLAYGYGALEASGQEGNYHPLVKLHVVQPRLNNFSTHELSAKDLRCWYEHELLPGLSAAEATDAPYNPSTETCRWCPRKAVCSARLSVAMNNAETIFAGHAKLPDVPLQAIKELLPLAEQVEQVIKDLKLYAQQQLSDGKEVPGYKLVRGRSNRTWVDLDLAGEFLSLHLEPEEMYESKMLSPAKAEKLLDRTLRKADDFVSLVYKPEGKVTLAVESDKRPSLSLDAESVFAGCTGNKE